MTQARFALLIACDEYSDSGLKKLKAPTIDVENLTKVLKHPKIGGYQVKVLKNRKSNKVSEEVEKFLSKRRKEDVVLIYFACHGYKGPKDGLLYLAASNTNISDCLFRTTTISAALLKEMINDCNSTQKLLILDCCYSGAYLRGFVRADDKLIGVQDQFSKSGTVCITSSTAMQFSFEGPVLKEKGEDFTAIFTNALIEGLRTGDADDDEDGSIKCEELFEYARNMLVEKGAQQNPQILKIQSDFGMAQNINYKGSKTPNSGSVLSLKETGNTEIEQLKKLLIEQKISEFNRIRSKKDFVISLRGIDLNNKNLTNVDFHGVDLTGAEFEHSTLKNSNLRGTRLKNADFAHANLSSSDLYGANLTNANLSDANLQAAYLAGWINFSSADLSHADLKMVDLDGVVNFNGTILKDVDFTGAKHQESIIITQGAIMDNVTGLQLAKKINPYLSAVYSFSEVIGQQLNTYNIIVEDRKPIEDAIKVVAKEINEIKSFQQISDAEKKFLTERVTDLINRVLTKLPFTTDTLNVFSLLNPVRNIIYGDMETILQEVRNNIQKAYNLDITNSNSLNEKANELYNSGKYQEANKFYDMGVAINPWDDTVWSNKGNSLLESGQYEEALAAYDKALEIDANNADTWIMKGIVLDILNRYNEELDAYNKALEIDPNYALAWLNKGLVLDNLERYSEALAAYNKALEIDRHNAVTWVSKGSALDNMGKIEEALDAYNKALEIQPKYALPYYNMGVAFAKLDKYDKALDAYNKALEINPKDTDSWISKGVALSNMGKNEEALDAYNKALEIDDKLVQAWINKAGVLDDLQKHDEAIKVVYKALEIDQNNPNALDDLGYYLFKSGKTDEAILAADKAIKSDPKYANAWYNRASYYVEKGWTERAIDQLEKAIELDRNIIKLTKPDNDLDRLRGNPRFDKLI